MMHSCLLMSCSFVFVSTSQSLILGLNKLAVKLKVGPSGFDHHVALTLTHASVSTVNVGQRCSITFRCSTAARHVFSFSVYLCTYGTKARWTDGDEETRRRRRKTSKERTEEHVLRHSCSFGSLLEKQLPRFSFLQIYFDPLMDAQTREIACADMSLAT